MQPVATRKVGDPSSAEDRYWQAVIAEAKRRNLRVYLSIFAGSVRINEPENLPGAGEWLVNTSEMPAVEQVSFAVGYILETRYGWSYDPEA